MSGTKPRMAMVRGCIGCGVTAALMEEDVTISLGSVLGFLRRNLLLLFNNCSLLVLDSDKTFFLCFVSVSVSQGRKMTSAGSLLESLDMMMMASPRHNLWRTDCP